MQKGPKLSIKHILLANNDDFDTVQHANTQSSWWTNELCFELRFQVENDNANHVDKQSTTNNHINYDNKFRQFFQAKRFHIGNIFLSHSLHSQWLNVGSEQMCVCLFLFVSLFSHKQIPNGIVLKMRKSINQIAIQIQITYTCAGCWLLLSIIVKHRTLQRNAMWIDRINPDEQANEKSM